MLPVCSPESHLTCQLPLQPFLCGLLIYLVLWFYILNCFIYLTFFWSTWWVLDIQKMAFTFSRTVMSWQKQKGRCIFKQWTNLNQELSLLQNFLLFEWRFDFVPDKSRKICEIEVGWMGAGCWQLVCRLLASLSCLCWNYGGASMILVLWAAEERAALVSRYNRGLTASSVCCSKFLLLL